MTTNWSKWTAFAKLAGTFDFRTERLLAFPTGLTPKNILKQQTMTSFALNTLDLAFTTAEKIERFDYVALGQNAIKVTATVAAIVTGFCSYVWLALQLFWEDHGETITVGATKSVILAVDFTGNCLIAGRKFRVLVNQVLSTSADRAFYLAAGY